jgi:hypothetical protein
VLATPQLFTALAQGLTGLHSFGWEMRHGVLGSQDGLTLYFFEWPDLGTYFLVHGLGWGVSWPIVVLAIAAIMVAWRLRKIEPALAWTAAAAVLWYAAAEATPLKRGGDVERYVMPCVPLFAALAAGWTTRWRRPEQVQAEAPAEARGLAAIVIGIALLSIPLAHSLLLTAGLADDTRTQAARWLEQHGPEPPYEIAFIGQREYHLDSPESSAITMTRLRSRGSSDRDRAAVERSTVLALSELETRRFEDFPRKSRRQLAALERLRAGFPVVVEFRKPFYEKGGFHNPDIELRFRGNPEDRPPDRVP